MKSFPTTSSVQKSPHKLYFTQPPFTHRTRPFALPIQAAALPSDLQQRAENSIVIIGGGPAGLATALALQRVNIPAIVLERDERANGSALGLWTNAWRALDALGVADDLRKMHPKVERVDLCRNSGKTLRSFSLSDCDGGPHEFRGVRRSNLASVLESKLHPGTIIKNSPVTSIKETAQSSAVQLTLQSGEIINCLAAVGADGVRGPSVAAAGQRPARFVGQVAIRGVARFPNGSALPCDSIRQVWSVGPRAGMYPISDTELYWFVCFDDTAGSSSNTTSNSAAPTQEALKAEALNIVQGWSWNLVDIVNNTPLGDFTRSRIADRWTLPNSNNSSSDQGRKPLITLAGDALHPMTPNLGQGGCTALEDAIVLARSLKEAKVGQYLESKQRKEARQGIERAFSRYEAERLQRCLPLTVRSFAMGAALQLPVWPVAAARDLVVSTVFNPSHFLDHAEYDCGRL